MRRVSKIIQLEIWFTEVGRNLGGKYLEPADRFRPKAVVGSASIQRVLSRKYIRLQFRRTYDVKLQSETIIECGRDVFVLSANGDR